MKKVISIVVPCYNEEAVLGAWYDEMTRVAKEMKEVDFEFVLVDDGSSDGTLTEIEKLVRKDSRVRFVSFSRNFGKEAALLAGLEYAKGDYIATMDADLQDPPKLLPEMYKYIESGEYDCVGTRRVNRDGEPPIRSFFARIFYKLINRMSKIEMVDGARDYRLMTRQMVNAIISMREYNRYSKGLFSFVGFRTKWIEFKHVDRAAGETHWSFWKLFVYALEGICAFSTVPLVIAAVLGLLFCFVAFVMIVVIIVKTLAFGDPVSGWPSMICVVLMVGGLQMLALGVIGQYLAKTYLETKQRPVYIVRVTDEDLGQESGSQE
ncbi:glycosyltransferase family 2 protein [uncultured Bacteroides sp.]|uniref:glycosyltransferase family 2 protein n=1 Tax=uncultured Bacteroides sp. TaxID=162156 RepID=UPI00272DB5A1|nr:glycosyltransferase family 2 protein [uncultured Bacteroides sp.]